MKLWDKCSDPKTEEVWVELFGGRYAVSSSGRIKTKTRSVDWVDMKPIKMASGYLSVGIYPAKGERPTTHLVHRLVAETFYGPPAEGKTDVRHLDGDKTNNDLTNLAWGSRSENMLDVVKHRGQAKSTPAHSTGEKWYRGQTTNEHVVKVGSELHAEGVLTIKHLARLWDCSYDVASNIVHKKTRLYVDRPEGLKQKRRSPERKKEIRQLVEQGKTLREINESLQETLTAQDLYYYKSKSSRA